MDNYQIALCVVSVVFVLSMCVTIYHAVKCSKTASDLMNSNSLLKRVLAKSSLEISFADSVAKSANVALKDATDQLKQIQDLRMAGKEWWICLTFIDDDGKYIQEDFRADTSEIDTNLDIVYFFVKDDDESVYEIERDKYVLHKRELVDIDNGEEKK